MVNKEYQYHQWGPGKDPEEG